MIKLTDLTTNAVISGIKLTAYDVGGYGSTTKMTFLDADEIDSLLKAMAYINEKVFTTNLPSNPVEYNYRSRRGFTADGFSSSKKWKGHLQLEQYDSHSGFIYTVEEFKKIGDLTVQAQTKLKSL